MKLDFETYKSKLLGCWMGKNIGGTLGAPFEAKRQLNDVDFYTQDLQGEPLPNDDLDLQLVWLNAAEKFGRQVNARILGEYWLSYIVPNWAEYGAGMNNMRIGLVPPLSGFVDNAYRNSNGAYILSEIWACLTPGHPEIAAQYAYEDSIVDHSHEGVYAEVFFAVIESAAFVEGDTYKLIDIGLSYLPEDCGLARGIEIVKAAYANGLSWQEARLAVLNGVPGTFGLIHTEKAKWPDDIAVGELGWDAPSNVALTVLAWIYGEGDFGNSICIATNCGEDTDCTAATLGSILGIIHGIEAIPVKWIEPIGNSIKTFCVNLGDMGIKIPKTVDELTERIIRLTPSFLGSALCDVLAPGGYTIEANSDEQLFNQPISLNPFYQRNFLDTIKQSPFQVKYDFSLFSVYVDYVDEPFVQDQVSKKFRLIVDNNIFMQQWLTIKWHLPTGWTISPGAQTTTSLEHFHCNIGRKELEFELLPAQLTEPKYDLILEISSHGRPTKGLIPITLLHGKPAPKPEIRHLPKLKNG